MSDKLWKSVELRLARYFGTERIPRTGKPVEDFRTDRLIAEVKHRKKLPKWILEAVEDAEEYENAMMCEVCYDPLLGALRATRDSSKRIPIAILHEKQMKIEDSLVVIRAKDFRRLL